MGLLELLIQGFGLSMDAFSVSLCKGLATKKVRLRHSLCCGAWFGGFQALMPLLGYLLASTFRQAIERFDHWIAFVLLGIIGLNMLKEAFEADCEACENHNDDFGFRTMLIMAIATSIDACASGVSMGVGGFAPGMNIWIAIAFIGGFTFAFCALGVKIGSYVGAKLEKKAQVVGGVTLILLGTYIMLGHLLGW